ncbi:site-specific DNA-methyltransferase, partial [Tenacibaculum finnmarkense]
MEHIKNGDKLSMSKDLLQENIGKLKELFPELITENKIDFNVFRDVFGDEVEEEDEYYRFTWAGKAQARREAHKPSTGTLRPVKEDSVEWDTTENVYIEGDNLEVLKLLQKSYAGKVKMIYIDPPYNTGKDFVYKDNYKDNLKNYQEVTGQVDSEGNKLSTNSDSDGRYHSNWLNMMYPRLRLARNLLKDDGVIFISIGEQEAHNLRKILDEIFGESNFQTEITWQKRYTRSNNTIEFTTVIETIFVYSKSSEFIVNLLPRTEEADARYTNPDNDKRGVWKGASFLNPAKPSERPNLCYPIENPYTGLVTLPTSNAWRRSKEEFNRLQNENLLYWGKDNSSKIPSIKMFLKDSRGLTPTNFWNHEYAGNTDLGSKELEELFKLKVFDFPKPTLLIKRILEHSISENEIVLDFFSGSASFSQSVFNYNLEQKDINVNFIQVQLPEKTDSKSELFKAGYKTIAEIGKERIRRAGKKIAEQNPEKAKDLDLGFKVFKLDSSNIKSWDGNPENLQEELFDAVSNIKTDRTEEDVLYEILLKYGLDLTLPIEEKI